MTDSPTLASLQECQSVVISPFRVAEKSIVRLFFSHVSLKFFHYYPTRSMTSTFHVARDYSLPIEKLGCWGCGDNFMYFNIILNTVLKLPTHGFFSLFLILHPVLFFFFEKKVFFPKTDLSNL